MGATSPPAGRDPPCWRQKALSPWQPCCQTSQKQQEVKHRRGRSPANPLSGQVTWTGVIPDLLAPCPPEGKPPGSQTSPAPSSTLIRDGFRRLPLTYFVQICF